MRALNILGAVLAASAVIVLTCPAQPVEETIVLSSGVPVTGLVSNFVVKQSYKMDEVGTWHFMAQATETVLSLDTNDVQIENIVISRITVSVSLDEIASLNGVTPEELQTTTYTNFIALRSRAAVTKALAQLP